MNLDVVRLRELQGEPEAALMAVQRRTTVPGGERYLSTFLREEGRLAALVGNNAAAIRAYAHYVGLRSDPEPGLRSEVDQILRSDDFPFDAVVIGNHGQFVRIGPFVRINQSVNFTRQE